VPHASIKLKPGIDQNETPALNEAGISLSNLIRFIPDQNGIGLIQKLGGWLKYYSGSSNILSIIRALWAWEDTNASKHLVFGTETNTTGVATLGVINDPTAAFSDITPRQTPVDVTALAATTSGSPYVIITDASVSGISQYDSVYISTHISVGGIVLFGLYQCDPDGYSTPGSYSVLSTDILGNPLPATSTQPNTAAVLPLISTTVGSISATITLPNHGYAVGDTFPILIETTVGNVNFYGNYIVQSVVNADNFIIYANANVGAILTATGYVNGNNAHYIYSFGVGTSAYLGYGLGLYGYYSPNPPGSKYGNGTPVPSGNSGTPISANDWTLDNWGQILISCATNNETQPQFQPIYQWDPTSQSPYATIISNAPPVNDGIFVAMPQRQIVAWGSTETGISDPLLLRWCDVNNFDSWIPLVTNQAGSYRIPKGSKIVGCIQGPQQGLIWTDIDVWSMQYIGPPYVYSFNEIGTGCGLISKKAAASINGVVYWMGPSQFFSLTGNGVQPVFCPVWDVIFQDLDTSKLDKIRVAVNSRFGEISWFYPTTSNSGEINAYVKYNVVLNVWDFGSLSRTAWIDQSVLGPPIGADPGALPTYNPQIYQHETSANAATVDGSATPMLSSFQTGWLSISDADVKGFIDEVWPDMKWGFFGGTPTPPGTLPLSANVNITFYATDFASQSATQASFNGTISATTLIVNQTFSGVLEIGQYISGAGLLPNTQITGFISANNWTITPSQTVSTLTGMISSAAPIAVYGPYTVSTATNWFNPRIRARLLSVGLSSNDLNSFWRIGNIRYRIQPDGRY